MLEDLEGQVVYGCDIAFKIFENENINGSYTCIVSEWSECL